MDWLPVESAPKDLEAMLLYWPRYTYTDDDGGPCITIGWWKQNDRTGRDYYSDNWELDDYGLAENGPTHWMPLPDPPA